jgi:hypothetical protein
MWALKAVKFGYKWHVGNGKSIKFWEDIWFGISRLATQFWDLYFFYLTKKIKQFLSFVS